MLPRLAKILLLAGVMAWAVGAAQYLHERVEYHNDADPHAAAVHPGAPSADLLDRHEGRTGHHHDHDHCPTCQLLAHLTGSQVPSGPVLCGHQLLAAAIMPGRSMPETADALHSLPIRGPPAQASVSV